jgi:betaine-aldehyde dehydrogenase
LHDASGCAEVRTRRSDPHSGSLLLKSYFYRFIKTFNAGGKNSARHERKSHGCSCIRGKNASRRSQSAVAGEGLLRRATVFADVTMDTRIGKEEIFGPILFLLKWSDEEKMLAQVNQVEYGLTCSIWTNDLITAHRAAAAVEAGFVWTNDVSKHFLGAPFGGYKQSGVGREEGIEELISFTREKNIHLNLKRRPGGH